VSLRVRFPAAQATVALAASGLVAGLVVGSAFETLMLAVHGGVPGVLHGWRIGIVPLAGVFIGGITGIATPVLAWLGLRRVAIGRMMKFVTLAAAGGACSAAEMADRLHSIGWWNLGFAFLGALAGGSVLGIAFYLEERDNPTT
jgi:hypothetical protein